MDDVILDPERKAVSILKLAKEEGRAIVPFLGAGISAGSGFPLVESLRQYLLKVRFFIQYGGYRHALGLPTKGKSPLSDPEQNPSRYLSDFGWPNPNQLNSDLYRITHPSSKHYLHPDCELLLNRWLPFPNSAPKMEGETISLGEDPFRKIMEAANRLRIPIRQRADNKPSNNRWIDSLVLQCFETLKKPHSLCEILRRPKDINTVDESVCWEEELRPLNHLFNYFSTTTSASSRWGRGRWRLLTAAQFALLEDLRLYDSKLAEAIEHAVWSLELVPTSDWARQLMQLSEGHLTLIDALMSMLGLRYSPGLSHRMMAQLVRNLGLPLLLTINFDPYLEQALVDEGISPRVLDVSRDDDPPDVSVVRQALSIIKLHGSSHSIRLGERLDYALDDDTRKRVERFVPDNAVLLVIGFSGYERRMMQLIDHLATKPEVEGAPRVLWMHFEPNDRLPATLVNFQRRLQVMGLSDRLHTARLSDAGEFLFHFYQAATLSYPKVRVPVSILPKRVVALTQPQSLKSSELPKAQESISQHLKDDAFLHVFVDAALIEHCTLGDR